MLLEFFRFDITWTQFKRKGIHQQSSFFYLLNYNLTPSVLSAVHVQQENVFKFYIDKITGR